MRPHLPEISFRIPSVEGASGPIRLVVFGAGKAARFHLDAIGQIPGVTVAGICSRTGDTAVALAAAYPGALATADPAELVDPDLADAAIVAVSHDYTSGLTRSLLEAQIPVLVEKPAAPSAAEVEALAELAEQTATLGLVAVNRRYYSLVLQALAAVRQRGPVRGVVVEGHENTDTLQRQRASEPALVRRWLMLNSIHFIDLLRLVGGEVEEVQVLSASDRVPGGDHFSASVRFRQGAIGTYIAHWNSAATPQVRIFGDEVTAEVRLAPPEDGFVQFAGKRRIRLHPDRGDELAKPGVLEQDLCFFKAVSRGSNTAPWPASDLADHAASLRLVEAIGAGR